MTSVDPLVYLVSEVAAMLKMSEPTVYRQVAAGKIPALRYGRAIRVPKWWVDERIGRAA